MNWWESLVQVRRNDSEKGSGVFISETEVLTAAHVVTKNSQILAASDLAVDIRYQTFLAVVLKVAVLPAWTTSGLTRTDIALLRVPSRSNLGVPTVFDVPAPAASVMLEGAGFEAQNDTARTMTGMVECRLGPAGERLLYTSDFAPVGGMSGGPICVGLSNQVRVVGILTRASSSGLVGLSITAPVLAQLRSLL